MQNSKKLKPLLLSLTIALAVVVDQFTKYLVLQSFKEGEQLEVISGFFNLTLHFNRGAAFGLMAGMPDGTRQILLALTTIVALGCVGFFLFRGYFSDTVGQLALGLVVGGAIGNIIDRIRLGEVVDFLDFYYSRYHWPAFNVADSCICVGVALLLVKQPKKP